MAPRYKRQVRSVEIGHVTDGKAKHVEQLAAEKVTVVSEIDDSDPQCAGVVWAE
jgi:hypothetical protein